MHATVVHLRTDIRFHHRQNTHEKITLFEKSSNSAFSHRRHHLWPFVNRIYHRQRRQERYISLIEYTIDGEDKNTIEYTIGGEDKNTIDGALIEYTIDEKTITIHFVLLRNVAFIVKFKQL